MSTKRITVVQLIPREPVRCPERNPAGFEAFPQFMLLATQFLELRLLTCNFDEHLSYYRRNRCPPLCSPNSRPVIHLIIHRYRDVLHIVTVTTRADIVKLISPSRQAIRPEPAGSLNAMLASPFTFLEHADDLERDMHSISSSAGLAFMAE